MQEEKSFSPAEGEKKRGHSSSGEARWEGPAQRGSLVVGRILS